MNIAEKLEAQKQLLSCPGDTIQETIEAKGMSQAELAKRLGRSVPKVNELIKGKTAITPDTATKLEFVLDVPTSFWLNLESEYQEELAEIKRMEFLATCEDWISKMPINTLKKWNYLPNTKDKHILAEGLLKFFQVASPKEWEKVYQEQILAFKIEQKFKSSPESISAWLRIGEIQAENLEVALFDKKKLREQLSEIQKLSYEAPNDWMEKLQELCGNCGVALVYTPCLKKAPIYGASRWIHNHQVPLIQVTDRQKRYNAFWFTFYHELAHILYHGKRDTFISLDDIQQDETKEVEANEFASRQLLSDKERKELFAYESYDKELILRFAEKYKKHPSILVAQLQRENHISYKEKIFNELKLEVRFN